MTNSPAAHVTISARTCVKRVHIGLLGVFSDVIGSSGSLASCHRAKMAGVIVIGGLRKRTKSEDQPVSLSILYLYISALKSYQQQTRETAKTSPWPRQSVLPSGHSTLSRCPQHVQWLPVSLERGLLPVASATTSEADFCTAAGTLLRVPKFSRDTVRIDL